MICHYINCPATSEKEKSSKEKVIKQQKRRNLQSGSPPVFKIFTIPFRKAKPVFPRQCSRDLSPLQRNLYYPLKLICEEQRNVKNIAVERKISQGQTDAKPRLVGKLLLLAFAGPNHVFFTNFVVIITKFVVFS